MQRSTNSLLHVLKDRALSGTQKEMDSWTTSFGRIPSKFRQEHVYFPNNIRLSLTLLPSVNIFIKSGASWEELTISLSSLVQTAVEVETLRLEDCINAQTN